MKIDFYVLETTSRQKAHLFACELLEKMYGEQKTVYVQMRSEDDAQRFDALLWTYKDDSFLPHDLTNDNSSPIKIGFPEKSHIAQDILFNLNESIPLFFTEFQHVIEIVFTDAHVQQLARERYKQYRDQGYDINTIKLKAS